MNGIPPSPPMDYCTNKWLKLLIFPTAHFQYMFVISTYLPLGKIDIQRILVHFNVWGKWKFVV